MRAWMGFWGLAVAAAACGDAFTAGEDGTTVTATGTATATGAGAGGTGAAGAAGGSGGSGAAGAAGGTGGAAAHGAQGGEGGTGGQALPCDEGFAFADGDIVAGVPFAMSYSNPTPLAYVEMAVAGPGPPTVVGGSIDPGPPSVWHYTISNHGAGILTFQFKANCEPQPCDPIASCQAESFAPSDG